MGYKVIVLKEGYTVATDMAQAKYRSCGTVTLLKGPKNILVDTGNPWDRDYILEKLREQSLKCSDIDYVVCTHGHSDHVGNLNLFLQATCIVSYDICHRDEYIVHGFNQDIPYEIDNNVEVIATPGHTGADVSVVVSNTEHGTVVVAGDLFECEEDFSNPQLWQNNSENIQLQRDNRYKILNKANYIIPGHGGPFVVVESYRRQGSVTEPVDVDEGVKRVKREYSVIEAE